LIRQSENSSRETRFKKKEFWRILPEVGPKSNKVTGRLLSYSYAINETPEQFDCCNEAIAELKTELGETQGSTGMISRKDAKNAKIERYK
jgi:hypothetical protein